MALTANIGIVLERSNNPSPLILAAYQLCFVRMIPCPITYSHHAFHLNPLSTTNPQTPNTPLSSLFPTILPTLTFPYTLSLPTLTSS